MSVTNTQHFINAYNRSQQEDIMVYKDGAPGSQNFIAVNGEKAYVVEVLGKRVIRCNCHHNVYRNVVCKHMLKVSLTQELEIAQLSPVQLEDDVI